MRNDFDIVIIGAGVIGLAIGEYFAKKNPQWNIIIIEKNSRHGQGISSRNSEVIHSGIYYPKDWLKSKLCIKGRKLLYPFLEKYNIPYRKMGKLIVATNDKQIPELYQIYNNAIAKGVDGLSLLSRKQIQTIEPNVNSVAAIFSSETGVFSVDRFMDVLLAQFLSNNGNILLETEFKSVEKLPRNYKLQFNSKLDGDISITSRFVINSAGLSAVDIAQKFNPNLKEQIYFCKGHYLKVLGAKNHFNHLIYPLPSKTFLGIHSTIGLDGELRIGPDAVYLKENIEDYKTYHPDLLSKFNNSISEYWHDLSDFEMTHDMIGIRPKIHSQKDPQKDFRITYDNQGWIDLLGIESPGITSAMAFGEILDNMIQNSQ
jgi:2-hydroxyglutarate dehydrogenase